MVQASLQRIKKATNGRDAQNTKLIKFCNQYNQLTRSICLHSALSHDFKALSFSLLPHTLLPQRFLLTNR